MVSPTIRNNTLHGADNASIQIGHTAGLVTIENNSMPKAFVLYHTVNIGDPLSGATILWRNNNLHGGTYTIRPGWSLHPSSESLSIG